ncbi:PAS domain-containing hybrid sensor histidine kinase/response regulator [Desulfosporosinus sp.]|uniref:hybrid sensor histidine kinase/response regulator n=1 Tax=Desulfosporosinus sp. TaxID=157907 RepID=UPI0025BE3FC6|nr:PAS domain-containing hybrid sensor histidine kinase/response regulator [Desulfosporosinus sp.]MBC2724368.1 response regulator [Desulfosporosinus sp.]MBC2727063.1 response regulator [Desulfosporosinus sp.]
MDGVKLRQEAEAEALRNQKNRAIGNISADGLTGNMELEVHQIELSMQNDELQRVGLENELSRDKYRRLYDFAPVGFFTCGINGLILEVNRTGAALFEVEKDQLLGKAFTSFVVAEHQHIFSLYCKSLWQMQIKTKQECELNLRKNDGTVFCALVEGIAEKEQENDEKNTLCFLAVKDITERKKNEEDKLNYQRIESLGILAGGIAHDFNNLLTVILGNISLYKMKNLKQEKNLELLEEAEKACQQSTDLTLQLLTFAKGGKPFKEVMSIVPLLNDTVIFAMRGSNVRYELELSDDLWMVEVDGGHIRQVVNNLVINAQQAMPNGGTVSLRCENKYLTEEEGLPLNIGPYLKITVEDQGVGIHKDQLNRIFDPYFTTKAQGNGLGLATSYSIVKRHNGHIRVESEPGQGTAVSVYLPARLGMALTVKKAIEPFLSGHGKILVMDDQASIREVIGGMLSQLGCEPAFAVDGEEAILLYREASERGEPYDAVIFDLTVPGGAGGRQALEEIIKIDPHVKAITSSGYCNDAIMTDFKKYGFRAALPKPFCLEELSRVLRNAVMDSR